MHIGVPKKNTRLLIFSPFKFFLVSLFLLYSLKAFGAENEDHETGAPYSHPVSDVVPTTIHDSKLTKDEQEQLINHLAHEDQDEQNDNMSEPSTKLGKLLDKIDPSFAESEMNKIINYLAYEDTDFRDSTIEEIDSSPEIKDEILELINNDAFIKLESIKSKTLTELINDGYVSNNQLKEALYKRAWGVVENGSLNSYLGDLLNTTDQLQQLVSDLLATAAEKTYENKKLTAEIESLTRTIEANRKTIRYILGTCTIGVLGTIGTLWYFNKRG